MKAIWLPSTLTIAVLLSSGLAQAGPVFASVWTGDYTSYSLSGLTHTWDTTQPWSGDVVSSSTVGSQTASATNGGTYNGTVTSSSGSANLSTAQLKASESATIASGAAASNARADVQSEFGDSFVIFGPGGGPFSWTSATTVEFTLAVTGHIDPASTDVSFNLIFEIGAPGALANNGQSVGGNIPIGLVAGGFASVDGCNFGVGLSQSLGSMTCGNTLTKNAAGDVSGTVFAQFAPNGNFDWFTDLVLKGWPGRFSPPPGFSSANFSNTVTLAFIGPPGSTTGSASGVFPGTVTLTASPEPSTLALAGLGVVFVAVRSLKRQLIMPDDKSDAL